MKKLLLFLMLPLLMVSCEFEAEEEDEYEAGEGMPTFTICSENQLIPDADRFNVTLLNPSEWPVSIREHVATELPGIALESITSFEDANAALYFEARFNGNSYLLFNGNGQFICGVN